MQKKRVSILIYLLNTVTVCIAIVSGISVAAAYISPSELWWPAFFGLGFLYAYSANALLCFIQILRKRKIFLIPFIPLVAGLFTFYNSINFTDDDKTNNNNSVNITTYNVRLFDLYNWSHNMETRAKIIRMLQNEKPDIICFQEFYNEDKGTFRNVDTLKAVLNLPYVHTSYTNNLKGLYHFGIATFSRYPIVNTGELQFSSKKTSNNCIYTDLKINSDTVRIFNAHLESIRFKKEDYLFIENIDEVDEKEDLIGGRKIMSRLKRAFQKRAIEADTLKQQVNRSPYPVVFCGDFNDTPSSYAYNTLRSSLNDSFKTGPAGFGKTYNGPFPAFRIDYILYSDDVHCSDYKITQQPLSDHFPVSCKFSLKEKPVLE